ncbi:MAG: FkbM family methyltransferase, partial [Gemmatimonadales bacterium]
PNPQAKDVPHHPFTVSVTTLDQFCLEHHVIPDWLVMDIEGYEVAALEGARDVIRAGRGRLGLVVEMHPSLWEISGTSRGALERLLDELGLHPVALTGQRDPLADYGIVRLDYT